VPTFDPILRRLIARVVYDGPAFSGKTTNVTRICEAFPVERRSEVYTPGALKGRTMFFDWLEVDVGKVSQLPLSCQILSVPGQRARSYRRRPLIHSADAVVFVADSRSDQIEETRRCYALLRRYLRERGDGTPYVVQANKQDSPSALSLAELARVLRIPSDIPIVTAVAARDEGVRETFNAAVRAAIRFTQAKVGAGGLRSIAGTAQKADALLDALLELEDRLDEQMTEEDEGDPDEVDANGVDDAGWGTERSSEA
jgi:signal recognition particle receptor subunit beta